jgi:hypothetical protein
VASIRQQSQRIDAPTVNGLYDRKGQVQRNTQRKSSVEVGRRVVMTSVVVVVVAMTVRLGRLVVVGFTHRSTRLLKLPENT